MLSFAVPRLLIPLVGIAIVAVLAPLTAGNAFSPGDSFKDCTPCPLMVVVPPGSFRMGDLQGAGYFSEQSVRTVRIDYAFAVGKFEVTFDQWAACLADRDCE